MIAITAHPISAVLLLKQIFWWSWKCTVITFYVAPQPYVLHQYCVIHVIELLKLGNEITLNYASINYDVSNLTSGDWESCIGL